MWQIRNKLIATGLALILAACSSVAPLTEANKVWLGRPLADLVAAWGPPVQSFKAEDGGSIHSWSMIIVKRRRSEECRRSVLVNADGVIRRWLYDTCPRQQPQKGSPTPAPP